MKEILFLLLLVIPFSICDPCGVEGYLRLFGNGTNDGILEILHNNSWRFACTNGQWSSEETFVACRQMGFNRYFSSSYSLYQRDNKDVYWNYDGRCRGNEARLINCSINGWDEGNCSIDGGIYLKCGEGVIDSLSVYSPFSQFTALSNNLCTKEWYFVCADIVFLMDIGSSLSDYYPRLIELANQKQAGSSYCANRYGLTVFGLSDVIKAVYLSESSYFGEVTQLNSVLQEFASQATNSTTNSDTTAYEGINNIIDTYKFRYAVERIIVLITNEPRNADSSSTQHTYEYTLLNLLQNRINLAVLTTGVHYFNDNGDRLVGINFNDRIGIRKFSNSTCSTAVSDNFYFTTHTPYVVESGYEWNYNNYVQLAWNTNGSSFDLSYFHPQINDYCSVNAFQLFSNSNAVRKSVYCEDNTYSYTSVSISDNSECWGNIKMVKKSNCVDMILLVDRASSISSYYYAIRYLLGSLEAKGENCVNRFGLALFGDIVEVLTFENGSWGTPSELSDAFEQYTTGNDGDGYLALEYILKFYTFRDDVKKQIVLFINKGRSTVDSKKDSITYFLIQNNIILNVIYNTEKFYCIINHRTYSMEAVVLYSNKLIGFQSWSNALPTANGNPYRVDVCAPAFLITKDRYLHENYVELVWDTRGILFDISHFTYVHYNSVLFNTLMFSNANPLGLSSSIKYHLLSKGLSTTEGKGNGGNFRFHCQTNSFPHTSLSLSLIINGISYTNYNCSYISITVPMWQSSSRENSFICLASNGATGNVWLSTFVYYDFGYPFKQFAPNYKNTNEADHPFILGKVYHFTNFTSWTGIFPKTSSYCVDMVFLLDKTSSMDDYIYGIRKIIDELPSDGIYCKHRYGLTLFAENATAIFIDGENNLFGTQSQVYSELYYKPTRNNEDGLQGIDYVLDTYESSFRSFVPKHIILLTDEPRRINSSSSTKQRVLKRLNDNGVVLSVFHISNKFYYYKESRKQYLMAAIRISTTLIGFSETIDAFSPILTDILDSDAYTDYVELALDTGGIAFDLYFCQYSQYTSLLPTTFNKLMFSWGLESRGGPLDVRITYPSTNTTLIPTITYTYTETIVCTATGYPLPTILWYNSDALPVTTGPTLQLDLSNVSNGMEYICKAENYVGYKSRSIKFSILYTILETEGLLASVNNEISASDFDKSKAGKLADRISNILPNTSNIQLSDVDDVKILLEQCANTTEDLFDTVIDSDEADILEIVAKIANTAGNIVNRDNQLDRTIDSSSLSQEDNSKGGISVASDAMVTALRTIGKVCHYLGRNKIQFDNINDLFSINANNVMNIYGRNILIANIKTNETYSISSNANGSNIYISGNTALNLAGNQTSIKVVMAVVKYQEGSDSYRNGTGLKQASDIIVVVIQDRTGSIPLHDNAIITFSTTSRYPSNKVGSFLNENLWSTNGITTELTSDYIVKLNVNHFTSFVIFETYTFPMGYYLTFVSYAVSCISILCLIASLVLFILSRKKGFFKFEINILYFNLAIALLVSSILFILYGLDPDKLGLNDIFCKFVAGLIHYSCILVFTWCIAFLIYITYKIFFGISNKRKIYPYIIIFAWTSPLVIPIITVAAKFQVYVDESKHCFPSKQEGIYLSLLVPTLGLSLVTLGTLVAMWISYQNIKREANDEGVRADIKHIMISTAIFTSILTLPWVMFIIYNITDSTAVEWIFVLLNDALGICFLISIALRISEVRYLIRCKTTNEDQQNIIARISASQNPVSAVNIQLSDLPRYSNLIEDSVDMTPLETSPARNNTNRISNSDQPPNYELMFANQPNPTNQTAAVEHNQRSNPHIPTPVHPTGTQLDREHPSEI